MKKLLLILCCSVLMFSFSQENDRILEIKDLYSKIISATPHSIDTVSWTEAVNDNTYNLKRTFIYSYFENNLSKIDCEIMQDHFLISSEYYFENNELFFIFLTNDFGNEKEENRLYFNKFGGIEKLLVNYGNGNEEIKDENEINIIKESTLNWLEKGNAKLENREKPDEETLNIQLNYDKVIIEKKSDLEAEINVIAKNECISGDCVFGQGTYTFASGNKYVGEFKNGLFHGQGVFTWADGFKYVGEWKDNKYFGECISGNCKTGQGTYTWISGDKYFGEWKDYEKHGQGTYTTKYGDKYVGEWRSGKKHGLGTFTYECKNCHDQSGDKYSGEWKDNKYYGQGTYTWANGDNYVGEWRKMRMHGQGTKTWAKVLGAWPSGGDKYSGEWKDNKYYGQGTYTSANGDNYVGEFFKGKRNGQGTYTYVDGKIEKGLWVNGKLQVDKNSKKEECIAGSCGYGEGFCIWPNGDQYVGMWEYSKKHGQGVYTYADGSKYVGDWKDGKKHGRCTSGDCLFGQGTYTWESGDKYVGMWEYGKKHGQGTITYVSGNKSGEKGVGEWVEGVMIQGTYHYVNGKNRDKDAYIYVGGFDRGYKAGQGTLTYVSGNKSGDKFVGRFFKNEKHGQGVYTFADGKIEKGTWQLNVFIGDATVIPNFNYDGIQYIE